MVSTRSQLRIDSARPEAHMNGDAKEGRNEERQPRHESGSESGSESGDDDKVPARPAKRARTGRLLAKPYKKSNANEPVEPSDLMKLPVELLLQIASQVRTNDLLVLIRTNWHFRNMLLKRSTAQVWDSAVKQTPGLPRRPYLHMSGPAYAALVFLRQCTFCGAGVTIRPDVYLGVRLCVSCRNDNLVELNPKTQDRVSTVYGLVTRAYEYRLDSELTDGSIRNSHYALRSEVERVIEVRSEYLRRRERKELAKYDELRREMLDKQYKLCSTLYYYIKDMDRKRERERATTKKDRREAITERLKEMGWTNEDMSFAHTDSKLWRELMEVPKPLTERVWNTILPKLTALLEQNREGIDAFNVKKRRVERRAKVDQFMIDLKYRQHPYTAILDALGAPVPEPPRREGNAAKNRMWWAMSLTACPKIVNPFPKTEVMLQWDLLKDLDEDDISIEQVGTRLEGRKNAIMDEVGRWRTLVEEQLVKQYGIDEQDVALLINGSTDLTAHLPWRTRLLLRADVLFERTRQQHSLSRWEFDSKPEYYPGCVSSYLDILHENPAYPISAPKSDTDLNNLARHTEAETAVKRLLRDLEMPDVAGVELEVMERGFVCTRCSDAKAMTWSNLVDHYHWSLGFYKRERDSESEHPLRHPVVFQNVHDLGLNTPLVRLATPAEKVVDSELDHFGHLRCHVCQGTGRRIEKMNGEDLARHMRDWHLVEEPMEDIHYGVDNIFYKNPGAEWNEAWDTYHDEQVQGGSPSEI